ncbi:OLC1v1008463C1 [Oldenlandia corymbosa var. corymbosa]|uniref:OLC1v1008463C1 n=1 Tax=Oldenlandia corymbosa var. corymbosa TaxID=529605 RepID=A0AAV1DLN8_OLDCO|nr:OLC1v1008463C1 [Oldenlandia corymbosa var. corymbosa]
MANLHLIVNQQEPNLDQFFFIPFTLLQLKRLHFFSSTDNHKDTIDYILGVKAIEPSDLMSYLQADGIWPVVHQEIYKAFEDVKRADMIICNTIQELESENISALHENQPTYAIEPIFPYGFTKSSATMSLWAESDCTQWLNDKPTGSVILYQIELIVGNH